METTQTSFELYAASQLLLRSLEKRQHLGPLTRQRLSALLTLAKNGESTVKALAQEELVAHSTMSRLVSALNSAGLATTIDGRGITDKRTRMVRLTEKGKRTAERAVKQMTAEFETHISALTDEDLAILRRAIAIVHDIATSILEAKRKRRDSV